ncbi:hypothetical protein HNR44_002432 [Geomicrobium halophilum]|uniref:Uncharacterized protein n=1 Tax=Geomicrobium halophilum TaxID=549000 RepID=A0A841PNX0_9BACL|nr:hypothetical protein [Geomicrobium halophilum]
MGLFLMLWTLFMGSKWSKIINSGSNVCKNKPVICGCRKLLLLQTLVLTDFLVYIPVLDNKL